MRSHLQLVVGLREAARRSESDEEASLLSEAANRLISERLSHSETEQRLWRAWASLDRVRRQLARSRKQPTP